MLKVAYTPEYVLPLPADHRFPMEKYELIPEQLLYEGTLAEENFFRPSPAQEDWVTGAHSESYTRKLLNLELDRSETRRIGFPKSQELIERELLLTGGTVELCHHALEHGVAFNVAGGTHHAGPDFGEGFCLLNDVAVATQYLLDQELAARVLIIDLDVHQGNGTAQIFQDESRVFTLSMHGRHNFPREKPPSDKDVPLDDRTPDRPYLDTLKETLPVVLEAFRPDFLFYISGVDILASDRLGRLDVSKDGCRLRDEFVLGTACRAQLPIVVTMGGGYSTQIRHIVEAHCNTFRLARQLYD